MKILHLIGNGFDRNIGLKTGYEDFYYYYTQEVKTDDPIILKLKNNISDYLENKPMSKVDWSDLEIAIGKYTEKISNVDELRKIYIDLNLNLHNYIKLQEESVDNKGGATLMQHLVSPFKKLRVIDQNSLKPFIEKWNATSWYVNIITFNYTRTFEIKLAYKGSTQHALNNTQYNHHCFLQSIKHIHGTIDDTILVGVNDKSQIMNDLFKTDQTALDLLVKPQSNRVIGSDIDSVCVKKIREANLVCLFGLSLGDTDRYWWEQIGEQLKRNDFRLVYFVKGEELPIKHLIGEKIEECKKYLLSKTILSQTEKEAAKDKIFIGYNTDLFTL